VQVIPYTHDRSVSSHMNASQLVAIYLYWYNEYISECDTLTHTDTDTDTKSK